MQPGSPKLHCSEPGLSLQSACVSQAPRNLLCSETAALQSSRRDGTAALGQSMLGHFQGPGEEARAWAGEDVPPCAPQAGLTEHKDLGANTESSLLLEFSTSGLQPPPSTSLPPAPSAQGWLSTSQPLIKLQNTLGRGIILTCPVVHLNRGSGRRTDVQDPGCGWSH